MGQAHAAEGNARAGDQLAGRQVVARLEHVALAYENGVQALEDVTLEVERGERIAVLGANGSGKSTLASVICGLLAPDAGTVELLGERVFDAGREAPIDFDAYRRVRRDLGLVFQSPDDQIVTTVVEEDVAFGPENLGLPSDEIERRVRREIRRVAMDAYAKADPTKLSGGQKQRVAIAGALAMEPRILVLDEPGSLLDVRGREAILRVMGRLRDSGTTIVHVTHFMEEALEASRVIVLDHGRVALDGTPDEVFSQPELVRELGLELPFDARLKQALADAPESCPIYAGPAAGERASSLEVSHVSYSYRGRDARRALDDVSFAVPASSTCAIIGQTGSGKSTLLRLLCALELPDAGRVIVEGIDTSSKRERRSLHGRVGYVMQHAERQLFAETVMEDVAYGPANMGMSGDELRSCCERALETVGLSELAHVSPFELSGGQQRLCAIAGVLAMSPSVLVLDEPTAGLDPRGRADLRCIIDAIAGQGVTVVTVTHSMGEAAHYDQVIVLNESRIWMTGSPQEVFSRANEGPLRDIGLGLPPALRWALVAECEAGVDLGEPLTIDALVNAIRSCPEHDAPALGRLLQREVRV